MSILLVGASGSLGIVLTERLVREGDEVRAIATDAGDPAPLRAAGAHIARGPDLDDDLVERAGQNVRTVVLFDPTAAAVEAVVEGARHARVERLVLCATNVEEVALEPVRRSGIDYVSLSTGRRGRGLLRGRGLPDDAVAEAIDAADDIAGSPRLELDLTEPSAWAMLKLDAPV